MAHYITEAVERGMRGVLMAGGCALLIGGTVLGGIAIAPSYFVGRSAGVSKGKDAAYAAVANLRLSERKTNTLSLDQREDIFVRQVVPTFGLQRGSIEGNVNAYDVLRTACTTGVYGSNIDDFKVPAERVKATYEMCGWRVGQ